MIAIKRNLKYWGYSIEMVMLPVLGVMIMLGFFEYTDGGLEAALDYLIEFMPMASTIMMAMLGFVGAGAYFPFSISMGSTRKASFAGMQVMAHVLSVQIVLVVAGLDLLHEHFYGAEIGPSMFVVYVFCVLLSGGIFNIISAIALKAGKVWGIIVYMLVAVGGLFGWKMMLHICTNSNASLSIQLLCLAGSFVFDVLMGFVCFLAIRKYEVRV